MTTYVYREVRKLQGTDKVGDQECVALIRHYAHAPAHMFWKQGAKVVGNKTIQPGTAIATFEKGKFPGRPHGNHAAFYLGQVSNGIYVMDQWKSKEKAKVSQRFIYRKGLNPDGTFRQPSDNADAFFVIE